MPSDRDTWDGTWLSSQLVREGIEMARPESNIGNRPDRLRRSCGLGLPLVPARADPFLVDWARAGRNAQRRLGELQDRLTAAQRELSDAEAAVKLAERRFNVADEQIAEAERALDAARAEREEARRQRYAARQARDRARAAVDRLKRRLRELSGQPGPDAHSQPRPWEV